MVTAGGAPVLGFDEAGAFSSCPLPQKIADVTGAGDALAGATVAALLRGLTLRAALREGVAAAMLAVESATFTALSLPRRWPLCPRRATWHEILGWWRRPSTT